MIATTPFIIYSLPKSRTTQALKGGKIEKVLANVQHFLTACTNADIHTPRSVKLVGYTANEEYGELPGPAEQLIKQARDIFGVGTTTPFGYHYPSGEPSRQTQTEWRLSCRQLDKALDFMSGLRLPPKYNLGPMELLLVYDFKLIDIVSREELPNQQYTSSLLVWLAKNSCTSPSIFFPFPVQNDAFRNYIAGIENLMPFKFDRKYLRLVKANKKGTANIFSKLL